MRDASEITIKHVWKKLSGTGLVELRINGRTVWSDDALDRLSERKDYAELIADYNRLAKEELLSDWYRNFRVTAVNIQIVDFHHCVADVTGYYIDDEDEGKIEVSYDEDTEAFEE